MFDMDLTRYEAIIFDLFHTLISVDAFLEPGKATADILGVSREQWNEQLFERSSDLGRGAVRDHYQILEILARALRPEIPAATIHKALEVRIDRFKFAHEQVPWNVRQVLKELKTTGKKLGLISNALTIDVAGWNGSPIKELFDSAVFSCDVGFIKPEPKIYELCLNDLKVPAEHVLFVGDGNNDELRGAKEMGMTTVLTRQFTMHLSLEKIMSRLAYADYVIHNIRDLTRTPGTN